jgi:hypothetical protein
MLQGNKQKLANKCERFLMIVYFMPQDALNLSSPGSREKQLRQIAAKNALILGPSLNLYASIIVSVIRQSHFNDSIRI